MTSPQQLPAWLTHALGTDTAALCGAQAAPYLTDWRKRYHSRALAVVFPGSTASVQRLVQACVSERVCMVPQGGNTGLVGGAVADLSGDGSDTLIINLSRLKETASVDRDNRTLTLSTGYTLQEAQQLAEQADLLFPLSLASEGSCTIGGNLSTNAGGTAVLRYGNTRDLVLGLEAVMPDGRLLQQLSGLRKDNTGYCLRQLLVGAEGTLGIITRACLKLHARPRSTQTAWISLSGAQAAVDVLNSLLDRFDAQLTSYEWMQHDAVMLVVKHFGGQMPVNPEASHALVEISSPAVDAGLQEAFESWAEQALTQQLISDCAIAQSTEQARQLWALRERLSDAQAKEGLNVKHDISLPVSSIPGFLDSNLARLKARYPGIRPVVFGHLGDGNLHYNLSCPDGANSSEFLCSNEKDINEAVLSDVRNFGGSISAEHGIGLLRRDALIAHQDPVALDVMRAIKRALDPRNLMNPGKLL